MKKVITVFVLICSTIIIGAVLFQVIRLISLPKMNDTVIYKGSEYIPMAQYGTTKEVAVKKAVGRFDDAVVYTIKDDPTELYLYPKVFLPHMQYRLFIKKDSLPKIDKAVISMITISKADAQVEGGSGVIQLDERAADAIINALEGNGQILAEHYDHQKVSEGYDLAVYFTEPEGLYFCTRLLNYGGSYSVLLENEETLVKVDEESLSSILNCFAGRIP